MKDIIFGIIALLLVLSIVAFLLYYGLNIDKRRKEYLSTLNEHDLSVITKYNACALFPFKRKGDKK